MVIRLCRLLQIRGHFVHTRLHRRVQDSSVQVIYAVKIHDNDHGAAAPVADIVLISIRMLFAGFIPASRKQNCKSQ
jgi:hypothetical protein